MLPVEIQHFSEFGHIHSGNHKLEKVEDTWLANVSYVDEYYYPSHEILRFQINPETKEIVA